MIKSEGWNIQTIGNIIGSTLLSTIMEPYDTTPIGNNDECRIKELEDNLERYVADIWHHLAIDGKNIDWIATQITLLGETTELLERKVRTLEGQVTELQTAFEILNATRGQPDPDCAVDPTGEWY